MSHGRRSSVSALAAIGLVGFLLLRAGGATAQAPDAAVEADTTLGAHGIRGSLTYRNDSYFQDAPRDDRTFYHEGILQIEWARRLAPWLSLRLLGEVRGDTAGFAEGVRFEIPDDDRHRSIVDLKEALAHFRRGPFELSLGKQRYAWGTADAFNPTDNLNPRDYMDPLEAEKMAVYSVAARATWRASQFTFVAVPVFTPSRLPLPDSRWAPGELDVGLAVIDERRLPTPRFDNVQYGARIQTTVRGWDVSASYFDGFEHTPVVRLSPIEVAPGIVVQQATPVFTRLRVLGLDFSTTWKKFEFHGEGAFKFAVRDGRHDRFQVVGGLSYSWDDVGLPWLERITVLAEYGKEVNLATRDTTVLGTGDLAKLALALPNNAIRDAAIARVAMKFTEDTELRLSGIVDFTEAVSHYVQVKLGHRFTDAVHAEVGLDLLAGRRGQSFFGQWGDNDRLFVSLKHYF